MTENTHLPSIDSLKTQAKRLRAGLAEDGDFISHSESLELIARQYGRRDWNTLYAEIGNRPLALRYAPGARITGRYLDQPFEGEVIGVQAQQGERTRLTIQLNTPVDVVKFDSFSAYRSRISATVNADGKTTEKTSNGVPQLIVTKVG